MILETQQNWFHNFRTPTKFYIDFTILPYKLIRNCSTNQQDDGVSDLGPMFTRSWPDRVGTCGQPTCGIWPAQRGAWHQAQAGCAANGPATGSGRPARG